MIDRNTFLEALREAAEIARNSDTALSPEEIHRYFEGMDLTAEQEVMISRYLEKPLDPEEEETENPDDETDDASLDQLSDSAYYHMYLNEVREKGTGSKEQLPELYGKLIAGEDAAEQIANGWLMRIIRMAEFYKENPVNMQDLIQEGNIALWIALGEISGAMTISEVDSYLENRVRNAFEEYIRETAGNVDHTQAVLAKAGLLHEAQEVLAKENGQAPSLRELSEYTHISVEEIQSILALYEQQEN